MDFTELEAVEGLRWPWNTWPSSRSDAAALVVPLSVICTPLMPLTDLPVLPYEPLSCSRCRAVLNPYARVDYQSALWICSFCHGKNSFPRSYAGIADHNLPAELFPTHSTVEYLLPCKNPNPGANHSGFLQNSFASSSSFVSLSSSLTSASVSGSSPAAVQAPGPAFVFVVDVCSAEEELRALKNEVLHVVANLPESALVGLVSFGSMVWVHDLGFVECSRVMLFCGDRELSSAQIQELLGASHFQSQKPAISQPLQKQGFLLPVSECEFNFSSAIEELHNMSDALPRQRRPLRATGAAISTAVAVLEGYSPNSGGRVMVFTSGPATTGPGTVAEIDHCKAIRSQRDIINGNASLYEKARNFYQKLSQRLIDKSFVLDLFACSLDQVGAAEMRFPIETSGGLLILAESFESEQLKNCLRQIFRHAGNDHLDMNFDATIELVTTKEVNICGALGPCSSLGTKNSAVSEKEIGQGGTSSWKMNTLTNKTTIAFIFQVGGNQPNNEPGPVFFIQFKTKYRHGNSGIRLRVTTAARRWATSARPLDISAGFDQEAAVTMMARLAVGRADQYHAQDVIRWLDKMLIRFTAKFGDYVLEDPSSFRLPPGFSLYPQLMYHLRRSQFMDIFNYSPDETAFFRIALNRQGVAGSLNMIQPTLFQYSFDGPPRPVLLDISSVSPDVILLFDSFFHVVIHYGSRIAQWRKLGFDKEQSHENLRKLLEAVEMDAEELIEGRIPSPKLIKCNQHGSQARFLLARLNPSATHKTRLADGSEVVYTDDVSLQAFLEHLQSLAVQG